MDSFFPTNAGARRLLYELLHLWSGLRGFSTFNVGFAPVDPGILAEPQFASEPHQIQLYAELVKFCTLHRPLPHGSRLLEVGAASGGGLRYIKWCLDAPEVVGVDNARIASMTARLKGVRVHPASADRLPFVESVFDCVLCVDSFSIFPQLAFLKDARRVLKSDGCVLIGDYLRAAPPQILSDLTAKAGEAGFEIAGFADATPGVLMALEADHGRKAKIISRFPGAIRRLLSETMSLRGSDRYRNWQSGQTTYYMAVLRPVHGVGIGRA